MQEWYEHTSDADGNADVATMRVSRTYRNVRAPRCAGYTRIPPLCTRALRCCLHQNQLRFSESGARNVIRRDQTMFSLL